MSAAGNFCLTVLSLDIFFMCQIAMKSFIVIFLGENCHCAVGGNLSYWVFLLS